MQFSHAYMIIEGKGTNAGSGGEKTWRKNSHFHYDVRRMLIGVRGFVCTSMTEVA